MSFILKGYDALTTKIYVDVLICINLIINFLLLRICSQILNYNLSLKRLIIGSIIGSLTSLVIFLPPLNLILTILIKILCAIIIVSFTFGFKNTKRLLLAIGCFFAINLAFAGIMMAVWLFISPPGMSYSNGITYFNISPVILIITSLICYIIITLLEKLFSKKTPKEMSCKIIITVDNKTINLNAYLDTGNMLIDGMTQLPVIIAEYDAIKSLFPDNIGKIMKNQLFNEIDTMPEKWIRRFRYIPFDSIGGNGMLCAFIPDNVQLILHDKKLYKKCIIAVYNGSIAKNGHNALIGKELLERSNQDEYNKPNQNSLT